MANVLVVANETLGGRALREAVQARAQRGDAAFTVIAPQGRPRQGLVIYDEAVRDAAWHRVEQTVGSLREVGVEARGEVMDPDPYTAVIDAVEEFSIDEVIVSTHPQTRSGWLRRDLVDRIREDTELPVEHVVVDLEAEREESTHALVVANQTVGGEALLTSLRDKGADGKHRFTVIVPQAGGGGQDTADARARLEAMLTNLRGEGLTATGGIGDPDPYTAIMNALQFYRVDEIVISTLPRTRSGWLRSDLIARVQRATACPVEHVVVDLEAESAGDGGASAHIPA